MKNKHIYTKFLLLKTTKSLFSQMKTGFFENSVQPLQHFSEPYVLNNYQRSF